MNDTDPKYWINHDEPLYWCWRFSGLTCEDFMLRHASDIEKYIAKYNVPYARTNFPTLFPMENNK